MSEAFIDPAAVIQRAQATIEQMTRERDEARCQRDLAEIKRSDTERMFGAEIADLSAQLAKAQQERDDAKARCGEFVRALTEQNEVTSSAQQRASTLAAELAKAREALTGAAYIACMTGDTNSERGWFIVGWHGGQQCVPNNEGQAWAYRRGMDARNALEPRVPTRADEWCLHFTEARAALAAKPETEDDPMCTDCDGTGITKQTERLCSCRPAKPGTEGK